MHDFHKRARERLGIRPIKNGRLCCADVHNLRYSFSDNNSRDRIVLRCKICHARHVQFLAEPGHIGLIPQQR